MSQQQTRQQTQTKQWNLLDRELAALQGSVGRMRAMVQAQLLAGNEGENTRQRRKPRAKTATPITRGKKTAGAKESKAA